MSIFVLFPFMDAIRRSFFSAMGGRFMGLANYKSVLQNEAFQLAAKNTLRFTAVCIPLLLILSLLLALAVHAFGEDGGVLKTSFLLPVAIPSASVVLLWQVLFHNNGLVNRWLDAAGLLPADWLNTEHAFTILVAGYIWKNCGYDMILWLSGLYGIPDELYEAARVDGAGRWQRFRYITAPALRVHLFTIAVLSLLNSFKVFREIYLLSGSYPHASVYQLQHLFNNWLVTLDIDRLCAAAALMALVILAVILLLRQTVGREEA